MEMEYSCAGEDDPVVKEMDVFLSQLKHLYLLQYPLHPAHMTYSSENVLNARVRGEGEEVEFDMKVRPRGENYSTSRGSNLAAKNEPGSGSGFYERENLFDQITLTSTSPAPLNTHRYAVAVFKNGVVHINPLQGLVQLRPSLSYLDKADNEAKKLDAAASSGGDATESEGEEAKPVTVSFAKEVNIAKAQSLAQKKVGHRVTFTEASEGRKSDSWTKVSYYGTETDEADEERRLLLACEEDQRGQFCLSEGQYLDSIFPKGTGVREQQNGNGASGLPMGVKSLEQIRKLPIKQQVLEVMTNSHVIQFGQLCTLLGVTGGRMGGVLQAVMDCGVLVQGCWVVASHVIYPEQGQSAERNARDYILWCFSQRRMVPRKDIVGVVKLPNKEVAQMMQLLAEVKVAPQQGWEFKLERDMEFISRNSSVVQKEEERWTKRHLELVNEIHLKSPATIKPPGVLPKDTPPSKTPPGASGSGSGGRGLGKGQKKAKMKDGQRDSGETVAPKLSLTPSRHTSSSSLLPQAIAMTTDVVSMDTATLPMDTNSVPMDTVPMDVGGEAASMANIKSPVKLEIPDTIQRYTAPETLSSAPAPSSSHTYPAIKKEEPNTGLMDALVSFCCDTLGRKVLSFGDMRDRLLLKQASVEAGHPLREQGVSDTYLENGLRLCGAMEVGQPLGMRLFALTHNDECRNTILELYQKQKFVKKKQVIDVLEARKINVPEKFVLKALKELCYGKGGHWKLLGT